MLLSKTLLETLKLIPKKGKNLDRLRKFIASDYHNGEKVLKKLFDVIIKKYPSTALAQADVWAAVFPDGRDFNAVFFRIYCSGLNDLIEQFLVQEQLRKDNALQQQLLAKAYKEKGEYKRWQTANNKAKSMILQAGNSAIKMAQLADLEQDYLFHPQTKTKQEDEQTMFKTFSYIEESYLLAKLRTSIEYLSRAALFENKKEIIFLTELLQLSQHIDFQENIKIRMYALLVEMYHTRSTEFYTDVVCFFEKNKTTLNLEDHKMIQLHLQNFLIQESNKGNQAARFEIFKNYQKGIADATLLSNGKINAQTFYNFVSAGCLALELEEIERFITDYQEHIQEKDNEIIVILSQANLDFYFYTTTQKTEYLDKILLDTNKIETLKGDILYNLILRMIICKSYYELYLKNKNQVELLQNYLRSFSSYVNRKKDFALEKRLLYLGFCTQLKQIVEIETSTTNEKEKAIKKAAKVVEIQNAVVANKTWLIEKLTEQRVS
jgi:hypothetical protein